MSVPVTEPKPFVQPSFPDGAVTEVELAGIEPEPPATTTTKVRAGGAAWAWLVSLILIVTFPWWLPWVASYTRPHVSDTSQSTQACASGQVEIEEVTYDKSGNEILSPYCITPTEYGELLSQAKTQYADGLKRGERVYSKWLATQAQHSSMHGTNPVLEAKTYLCTVDFNDGSLYAATEAELNEGVVKIAVGNDIIKVEAPNPQDQSCYNGAPITAKKVQPPISGMKPPARVEPPTNRP